MSARKLSKELQELAEKELNEVPSRLPEDLDHIKEWLKKHPYLKSRTDEQWLISFLRGCKYSLERTKEKLDNFYTSRSCFEDLFGNRDPLLPEIQEILQAGVIQILPNPVGAAGPLIVLHEYSRTRIETMSIVNIAKVFLMMLDVLMLENDNYVISGMVIWTDFGDFPLGYILQMTPSFLKKILLCVVQFYPGRIKGIHITNAPSIFETIYSLVKTIVTEKIRNRMSLHSANNMKNFYEFVPKDSLSKEFDGKNGSHEEIKEYWKKKLESYRDWFMEEKNYGTNEKLRPETSKSPVEVFGIEGSFRQLVID